MDNNQEHVWILFSAGDIVSCHKTEKSAKYAYNEYVVKDITRDFSPEDTYESRVRWAKLVFDTTHIQRFSLKAQEYEPEVLSHLATLDGSPESTVSFLTGLTREELKSLGGFSS